MTFKTNKNLILLVISTLFMIFYLNKKIEKLNLEKNIKIALDKKKLKRKIRYGGALGIGLTNSQNNQASWYFKRLLNPITRKIPTNIRSRELKFSESIPKNKTINSDWVERGPFNVGGRTRAIAIDVNNENIIMAGGVSGGIFRSENQGQTWGPSNDFSKKFKIFENFLSAKNKILRSFEGAFVIFRVKNPQKSYFGDFQKFRFFFEISKSNMGFPT